MEHGNVSFHQAGAFSLSLTLEFNRSYYLHITSSNNNTDIHPLLSPLTPGKSILDLNPISDLRYPLSAPPSHQKVTLLNPRGGSTTRPSSSLIIGRATKVCTWTSDSLASYSCRTHNRFP
ncbi:hypothetical protein TNCV_3204721 [Trichonephila clavipes]|nr:hypothetical protein TNCV_3204721 [Trichonephila clavipes]